MSTREVRAKLADAVNSAISGRSTFITQNGRRVARVAPLAEPPSPEQIAAEAVLQEHGQTYEDFLRACLRAVTTTPESMLKSLKPYWPQRP